MGDTEICPLSESAGRGRTSSQIVAPDAGNEPDLGQDQRYYDRGGADVDFESLQISSNILDEDRFQELIRCAESPWYFLTRYVYTQDPVLGVAPYPGYPFLRNMVQTMQQS